MTGHITDGVGFILNLKEHGVEGQKMVIIGTVFIEDLDNKEKFVAVGRMYHRSSVFYP